MSWVLIAILSYLILAVVSLGDKFLVDGVIKSAKAYAFIVSVLGTAVIVIAPWFLHWSSLNNFILDMAVGILFPIALYFTYSALKLGEASRSLILIGAMTPVFSLPLSLWLFSEQIPVKSLIGSMFLLGGSFIMIFISRKYNFFHKVGHLLGIKRGQQKSRRATIYSLVAAFIFAWFFIGSKAAYNHEEFFSAFIWLRLGGLLGAGIFIIRAADRKEVFSAILPKKSWWKLTRKQKHPQFLILGNQALGATGFVLQNYAIALGSVAVVNALQGVHYAALMLFSTILSIFYPKVFREDLTTAIIWKKAGALLLIGFGLYLIAI